MKKTIILLLIILLVFLAGCSAEISQDAVDSAAKTAETALKTLIDSIDWEELKNYTEQGYDALTERFPALKGENIQAFLKKNGLSLMNKYVESTSEATQENARKLGEILKILNPELTDEVNAILPGSDSTP